MFCETKKLLKMFCKTKKPSTSRSSGRNKGVDETNAQWGLKAPHKNLDK